MNSRGREDDKNNGEKDSSSVHWGKRRFENGEEKITQNHKRKLRKETPSYHGGVDDVTRQRIEDRKKKQPGHNRGIESLNEKFEVISGSTTPFINISKSSQDKRIQTLSILKY